jgi:hypothetical protein
MSKIPVPVPTGRDMFGWANQIVRYLKSLDSETGMPAPKVIQLEHKMTGAKATTDGLLMWSPADGTVVVSKAGEWYKVTIVAGGTP